MSEMELQVVFKKIIVTASLFSIAVFGCASEEPTSPVTKATPAPKATPSPKVGSQEAVSKNEEIVINDNFNASCFFIAKKQNLDEMTLRNALQKYQDELRPISKQSGSMAAYDQAINNIGNLLKSGYNDSNIYFKTAEIYCQYVEKKKNARVLRQAWPLLDSEWGASPDSAFKVFPRFELVNTGSQVTQPPASILAVTNYYTKYINADGCIIMSNDEVDDAYLLSAHRRILFMFKKTPSILQSMANEGCRIVVLPAGYGHNVLPEYAGSEGKMRGEYGGGLGQEFGDPTMMVTEAGMCYPGETVWNKDSDVVIHEVGHAIEALGLWESVEIDILAEINKAGIAANKSGISDYTIEDGFDEYWAGVVEAWFYKGGSYLGGGRSELQSKDPLGYALAARFFPSEEWDNCK